MAPPATAPARRAPARVPSGHGTDPRRPPLRLFQPAPRRRASPRRFGRPTLWLSGALVVGSLFAVVVADGMVTQGQVQLARTDNQVAAALATQKSLQVAVAEKAAPPVVVHEAEAQGLVAPSQVVDLPEVPLDVPLPAPHLTAAPAPAALAPATTSSAGQ